MFLSHLSLAVLLLLPVIAAAAEPLRIDTPMSPPAWAMLQRELLKANNAACEEFYGTAAASNDDEAVEFDTRAALG